MKTTLSTYDTQAADFLKTYGITCEIKRAPKQTPPQWSKPGEPHGTRYRVALSHPDRATLRFDFWGSINDAEKLIEAERNLINMQCQWNNTEPHVRCNLSQALAEREKAVADCHPTPHSVLACVSSDTYCPETFEEFCSEYGYDEDSRKAEATFRRCATFGRQLRAFFPEGPERDALSEIN